MPSLRLLRCISKCRGAVYNCLSAFNFPMTIEENYLIEVKREKKEKKIEVKREEKKI